MKTKTIHMAGLALMAITGASSAASALPRGPATAIVLIAAACKANTLLRYFLGLNEASRGWRNTLLVFVLLLCAAVGATAVFADLPVASPA